MKIKKNWAVMRPTRLLIIDSPDHRLATMENGAILQSITHRTIEFNIE